MKRVLSAVVAGLLCWAPFTAIAQGAYPAYQDPNAYPADQDPNAYPAYQDPNAYPAGQDPNAYPAYQDPNAYPTYPNPDAYPPAPAPAPAPAYAGGNAYTAVPLNMLAGPDPQYPVVAMLPAGVPVSIQGCLNQWYWCDVIAGPNRGWVAGQYLQLPYQGQSVYVNDYGMNLGIPIIAFSLGNYWDRYYRGRSWYGQRGAWINRRIDVRPLQLGQRPSRSFLPGQRGPVNFNRPAQIRSSEVRPVRPNVSRPVEREGATRPAVQPRQIQARPQPHAEPKGRPAEKGRDDHH